MKIKMLNTTTTWNYKYFREIPYENYDTEFIIKVDEKITYGQINCLLDSFLTLEETLSYGECFEDKRMITQNSDDTSRFVARMSLNNQICYNEFVCETDDFQTFKWYARNITIEEKAEDFKPIK